MTGVRLRARGLGRSFEDRSARGARRWALRGVDLDVEEGSFVSIVGPSGCGKSTLLELMAGLERPTEGSIEIGEAGSRELLGIAGLMPQADLLMPWRTVLANASLGPELDGMPRSQARALAAEQLARFGLEGFGDAWPHELSTGMRQRTALLRTFLTGSDLLLLDEPFAALDALTRASLQQWLLEVWQQERKTIVFVTHDVEEAVYLSDLVYVMAGHPGKIVAAHEITFARPRDRDRLIAEPEFVATKAAVLAQLSGG